MDGSPEGFSITVEGKVMATGLLPEASGQDIGRAVDQYIKLEAARKAIQSSKRIIR